MSTEPELNKPAQPKALGRGLSALINTNIPRPAGAAPTQTTTPEKPVVQGIPAYAKLELIDLSHIHANPDQPRKIFDEDRLKELSDSLKEQGLVQPIVVRRKGTQFEIVAGERRWRAAKLAGLKQIPAILRDDSLSTPVATDLASLVENLQREQLSPLELAQAYDRIIKAHLMTQDQLASKVGVSRVAVANTLRLLKLPENVKNLLNEGKITEGHARSLLALEDSTKMSEVAQQVVTKSMSVRELEQEVRAIKPMPAPANGAAAAAAPEAPKYGEIEEELRLIFGTKVAVRRGTIELYYSNPESLHRIVHQLRSLKS